MLVCGRALRTDEPAACSLQQSPAQATLVPAAIRKDSKAVATHRANSRAACSRYFPNCTLCELYCTTPCSSISLSSLQWHKNRDLRRLQLAQQRRGAVWLSTPRGCLQHTCPAVPNIVAPQSGWACTNMWWVGQGIEGQQQHEASRQCVATCCNTAIGGWLLPESFPTWPRRPLATAHLCA